MAGSLGTSLKNACQLPARWAWGKLIFFPYRELHRNIAHKYLGTKKYKVDLGLLNFPPRGSTFVSQRSSNFKEPLQGRVNVKIVKRYIRKAVREVCSLNSLSSLASNLWLSYRKNIQLNLWHSWLAIFPENGYIPQTKTASKTEFSNASVVL